MHFEVAPPRPLIAYSLLMDYSASIAPHPSCGDSGVLPCVQATLRRAGPPSEAQLRLNDHAPAQRRERSRRTAAEGSGGASGRWARASARPSQREPGGPPPGSRGGEQQQACGHSKPRRVGESSRTAQNKDAPSAKQRRRRPGALLPARCLTSDGAAGSEPAARSMQSASRWPLQAAHHEAVR